jgi:phage terminase Nu1 subunit (DNA packaging protein)
VSYSTAKIAKVLDLSLERVRQLTRQGIIVKPNGGNYELFEIDLPSQITKVLLRMEP